MTTKFFTNSNENTLLKKLEGVFKYTDVYFFDILVGYFRSSGYFRLRQNLDKVAKIRVLVGINVDKLIGDSARKGLEFHFNSNLTREEFLLNLKNDIQSAAYNKEVEGGIIQFVDDIVSGKLEIKAHPSKNIHAKIYIFRQKEEHDHAGYGAVITGSSNLTEAGLETNFEFNVELRDKTDIDFATETFEDLWKESIDIAPEFIEELKQKTYLNPDIKPYEIYIKLLIEYFGKSIEYDPEDVSDMPKGYKSLAYQIDAVKEGYNKLKQHNGFILGDVVGLGKTIVATIIAKKFYYVNGYRTKILVVHPPNIRDNWERTIRDFDVPNVHFINNGSIHKVKYPQDYDLIIVDEAHKFRSDETDMFNKLQKLCKTPRRRPDADGSRQKKVILITATPLNNKPDDIRNQIYLFQDSKISTLEVGNLQNFFRPYIDRYQKLKKIKDRQRIAREVKDIYDNIREKVLTPLIVRRTRTDIRNTESYWKDIIDQGLSFPNIEKPRNILYQLDDELDGLYDETLRLLKDTNHGIRYFRYQAIKYLSPELKKKFKRADIISEQLAWIMKTLLVKRIDSSFHAFKQTLGRYYGANTAMIKMFKNGKIWIAPKLNVSEFILNEDEATLEEILEEKQDPEFIQFFSPDDFNELYLEGLKHDQEILSGLVERWAKILHDPKLDELINKLNNELFDPKINDRHKLIIFSESKETTEYLRKQLVNKGFSNILAIDSTNQNEKITEVLQNFDANQPKESQKDDVDILITTEVLAEGINLHRANIVLNYDIPWNATRLMQRIGRVNRIGTQSEKIYIYNFFPTIQTDNEIELNKKAYMKLQGFHSALGEDSQIYQSDEEFGTFGLFEEVPEEERDERLVYLQEIRDFKDRNPEQFKRIRDLPMRSRCGRKSKIHQMNTITYLKNSKRDSFYYLRGDGSYEELTFLEAVKIYHAYVGEKPIKLHDQHHQQILEAIEYFRSDIYLEALGDRSSIKLGPNEQKAIAFLNNFLREDFVNDLEKELIGAAKAAIRRGKFQKLPREINKIIRNLKKENLKRIEIFGKVMEVIRSYPLSEFYVEISNSERKEDLKAERSGFEPEIIISESFS